MNNLKCYRTGECDLIAAYSPEQACEILIAETGCDPEDIDEVCECSEEFLSKPTVDEDGKICESWGETFARFDEPGYVGGWE